MEKNDVRKKIITEKIKIEKTDLSSIADKIIIEKTTPSIADKIKDGVVKVISPGASLIRPEFGLAEGYVSPSLQQWASVIKTPDTFGTTSHGPALAAFDGKMYMAWIESNTGKIKYAFYDGKSWSTPQDGPGWSSCAPALAVYKDKLYMVWKGAENDQRIWYSWFNKVNNQWKWRPQEEVKDTSGKNIETSHSPAIAECYGKLYLAYKKSGAAKAQIMYSSFNGTNWAAEKGTPGNTTHGPSLAVLDNILYMAYKGSGDEEVWYTSLRRTIKLSKPKPITTYTWDEAKNLNAQGVKTSCGPAIATYAKYWPHLKSYDPDPTHRDLYMVGKNKDNTEMWESDYRYNKELKKEWTQKSSVNYSGNNSSVPLLVELKKTSDTPALAEFQNKLYMAWKDSSSSKIYFSYCEPKFENHVRNIFDKTRPGKPVVRQDDLAVLRIETRNMKVETDTGKPILKRTNSTGNSYIILHFPPQSFGEETFFQSKQPEYEEPDLIGKQKVKADPIEGEIPPDKLPHPVRTRIAHESRLVFKVPEGCEIEYTLEGILKACMNLEMKVSTAQHPELPDDTTTSIEMPWRLILSPEEGKNMDVNLLSDRRIIEISNRIKITKELPNKFEIVQKPGYKTKGAFWRHVASVSPDSDSTKPTELWHTQMVTPLFNGNNIEEEIISPYPDEKRTAKAIWALSGIGSEMATKDGGTDPLPMQSNKPTGLPAANDNPFLTPLDNFDRYQIAHLSSNKVDKYIPESIAINQMMLSSLGGWLNSRGNWDPTDLGFSVEEWSHRATMGRDHFVRVVYKGFLYPFGHRVSLIKVSERKFHHDTDDNIAYLRQRMFIVVREKERFFNEYDDLFEKTKNEKSSLARKFPFQSVKILTDTTPDLEQPSTHQVKTYGQKMFWPHVGSDPFCFQCVATDLEGRQIPFELPMIFVDNTLACPRDTNLKPDFKGAEDFAIIAMNDYGGIDKEPIYNTANLNLQRVALAPNTKPGDTSVLVDKMKFGGFAKNGNISLQTYSKELTRPVWVPQVEEIDAKIESIANLTGAKGTHKLEFNDTYLMCSLGSNTDNKGEVFVDIKWGPTLDFSTQGDKSGGFIQPNLKPAALSRLAGPVMGNEEQLKSFIGGEMAAGAGFPTPNPDYNNEIDLPADLPMPLLFGCIPLGTIIKGVNGITGNLKKVPKFISEAGSKAESIKNDINRLKELINNLPIQANEIAEAALTAFNSTLDDIKEQALILPNDSPNKQKDCVNSKIQNVKDNLKLSKLEQCRDAVNALKEIFGPEGTCNSVPAGFKQNVLNTAIKIEQLLVQLEMLSEIKCDDIKRILNESWDTLISKIGELKTQIDSFITQLEKLTLLEGAPRNILLSALKAIKELPNDISNLFGDELTVRFDWNPEIEKWPNKTHPLFRPNDENGLLVSVVAKVKKNGTSSPNISVNCSLKHFDLILLGEANFIELNFEKIEFKVDSAAKMDVDVKLNDIKFVGVLSFVEALRDLIPLNGFSDPPYLDITSKGIDAGFSLDLPAIGMGVFTLCNLSLSAGFTVPFIGEPMSVRFCFCRREQPFSLTVLGIGGGGFFGITIDPHGVQVLEAALEFGAAIAINLGVACGEVHVMAGIYFRMEQGNASLTGYFRLGGSVSVIKLITASIELYLGLTYEFSSGKCVGIAQLTVEVSVLFFHTSVTITCERKFAGSNGDPTFRQMCGPEVEDNDTPTLQEELEVINENTLYAWREYIEAFTF